VGVSTAALLAQPKLPLLVVALIFGVMAIAAGSLHLGQPLKAWRSFLGWRKSWFSREVIAMSGFAFLLALAVGTVWLPTTRSLGEFIVPLAALTGLITVACSAMIYADTRRDFWNAAQSFTKFFGTTLVLGAAATMATLACVATSRDALVAPALVLALGTLAKLAFERRIGAQLVDEETSAPTPLNKTARLLEGELNGFVRARIVCGLFGGVALPFIAVTHPTANVPFLAVAAFVLSVTGELLERYLFFTAVATQKMPGGIGA
jgi:DMSO reductase anchor subunit